MVSILKRFRSDNRKFKYWWISPNLLPRLRLIALFFPLTNRTKSRALKTHLFGELRSLRALTAAASGKNDVGVLGHGLEPVFELCERDIDRARKGFFLELGRAAHVDDQHVTGNELLL